MIARNDALIALAFAVLGGTTGVLVLAQAGYVFFYQPFTPELVYWACGNGFLHPTRTPQPVLDFLFGHTHSLDCSMLQANQSLGPAGLFARSQFYLSWTIALLWRLSSVSYRNLWPLVGVLAGAYAAGCFILLRLFFQRTVAIAGSLVLSLSPVALSMIVSLRDYSKAPFFIWGIVFLIVAGRAHLRRATLVAAASAGTVVGVGYGFRADLMLLVPIGLLLLTLGLQHGTWRRRVWAPMTFIVAVFILAAPMLALKNTTGGGGLLIMQGATEPFSVFLGLGSAPYNLGWRYSDELTLSSIAADERANDPGWDANEGLAVYSVSQAIRGSSSYVLKWLPWFAGDMATQMLKSSAWVVGFPALVAEGRQGFDPGGATRSTLAPTRLISSLYDLLGRPWFPGVAIIGLLIFILRIAVARPREAVCVSLMLAALLSYPAIQFSVRHLFHLEFIWIMSVLALLVVPFEWPMLVAVVPRFALWAGIVAVTICVTYASLLAFQDYSLRRELSAMISLPREALALLPVKSLDDQQVAFSVPVPAKYRSLVDGPPDSMTDRLPETANEWDTRAAVDRLVLTLSGSGCPPGNLLFSLTYSKRNDVWQPLDHNVAVDLSRRLETDTSPTIVIVPAFYRPTQYLASINVPASHANCIAGIERITGRTRLPAMLSAVLAPGWQTRPLHRAFGGFSAVPRAH